MAYGPKFGGTEFRGGKNILASEHLQYLENGATLDATAFGAGYVEVGTPIARNTTSGKFEPFSAVEGYDNFSILNIDADMDGEQDQIAGEVIVRGSVYEQKLPEAVTAEFKAANPMIRYVSAIK